ncbi:RNA-directed DNA polymerase, eukaryota [Tanacetum coccineum]
MFNSFIADSMFNSFIADSGLVEVPLGWCHFTWCLKSAKKMSKLDRFLASEDLLVSCPHLTAVTLERYLSDHRPILLRENHYDYGPTPFRFFHHWIQTDGFDKIVSESWKNSPSVGKTKSNEKCYNLEAVDQILDSGQGVEEDIRVRSEIIHKLQNCDEIDSMELAQKAKIKWAMNKRFCKPDDMRATLTMEFPNRLHPDQSRDLEMSVSNEEIKKAVWECGTDKAPGPDGFTFGFFRHFWYIVEKDVCNAILDGPFILNEVIQWCKAKKKQTLIFKVDFEKAYDSVRWDFLDDVLSLACNALWKIGKSCYRGDKLAHQTLSHSFRRLPRGGIENAQFAEFSVLLQQEDNKTINMLTGRGTLPIDSFCPIKFNITRLKSYTESLASSLRYISTGLWEMPDMRLIRSYVEGPGLVLPFDGS